jgi:predicted transcriptional regulator
MTIMINIRLDERMRNALRRIAEQQFSSVSAVVKQAIEQYLQGQGIDWREKKKKPAKR